MNFKKALALAASVGVFSTSAFGAYDVVKRYKLLEDKFYTHEMLTPFGHDFLLDLGVGLNKNLKTFVSDANDVSKTSGDKLTAAQNFLREYDKTEQTMRVKFDLGIPLPTFTAFGVKIVPDLRAGFGLGMNLGIQTSNFDVSQILSYAYGVDSTVSALLSSCDMSGIGTNQDIAQYAIDNCNPSTEERIALQQYVGKYFTPSDTTVPNIFAYVKADVRAGLLFNYFYGQNWFGHVKFYGHGRVDIQKQITDATLAGDTSDVTDFGEENTTINLTSDLKFGYKNKNLRTSVSLEEVKLTTMSDEKEKAGELIYGNDPLLRVHADYLMKLVGFSIKPFAGLHKRSGYGFDDGIYAGSDLGFYVWKDRLGIRVRGMVDKEHFTFSPLAKLWFTHLEYMLKLPLSSDVDGVKPSAIHSINFRMFF